MPVVMPTLGADRCFLAGNLRGAFAAAAVSRPARRTLVRLIGGVEPGQGAAYEDGERLGRPFSVAQTGLASRKILALDNPSPQAENLLDRS
jgi:hypothetical protein